MREGNPYKAPRIFSPKPLGIACIVASIAAIGCWQMARLDPEASREYERLTSAFDASTKHQAAYEASQKKELLQKDVVFVDDVRRLHFRLCANGSELIFEHLQDRNEIVEKMRGVRCYMQEELYYRLPDGREAVAQADGGWLVRHADPADPDAFVDPLTEGLAPMQLIRYLEAENAVYHYKDGFCTAEDVAFSRYAAPGHRMENVQLDQLLMKGVADKVEFSLAGARLGFKAHGMRASFFKMDSDEIIE